MTKRVQDVRMCGCGHDAWQHLTSCRQCSACDCRGVLHVIMAPIFGEEHVISDPAVAIANGAPTDPAFSEWIPANYARIRYYEARSRARFEAKPRGTVDQWTYERCRSQLYQCRDQIAAWARRDRAKRALRLQATLFCGAIESLIRKRLLDAAGRRA